MGHSPVTDHTLDVFPHLTRHCVAIGVGLDRLQDREQSATNLPTLAVSVDSTQEHLLVSRSGDVHGVGGAIARLRRCVDACCNTEAQEQACDIIGEAPARRRVVDAPTATRRVDEDRSVRRPQVSEEERDLALRQAKNLGWDELLVAPLAEEPEIVEPGVDGVAHPMRDGPIRR